MATKNFEWTIEATKLLINLYEENECLYNNLDPNYKNRDKRLSIIASIANVISETTGRVCLVTDVRKKINSLRSQYLAEKLKITKCKSGSGGDYTPTVYWFPLLRFLDISTEADASESNLDNSSQVEHAGVDINIQQSREGEINHPQNVRKKKKKKSVDVDEDDLIKEAAATMRQVSQQINSFADSNINTFCNFINSELNGIKNASNNYLLNKAKRKIQMCLFDIWDEIHATSYEERQFTQSCTEDDNNNNNDMSLCNTQKSNENVIYYIDGIDAEESED